MFVSNMEKQTKLFETATSDEVAKAVLKDESEMSDLTKEDLINAKFKINDVKPIHTKYGNNVVIYIVDNANNIHSFIGNSIITEYLNNNSFDREHFYTIVKNTNIMGNRAYYRLIQLE